MVELRQKIFFSRKFIDNRQAFVLERKYRLYEVVLNGILD